MGKDIELAILFADVVGSTPAELHAFIKDETARLAAVIRKANIQLD